LRPSAPDLDGYARHLRDALPHASFIAFTGTPLSKGEAGKDTRAVFGEYIELIYDLTQAVEDGATVPVFYESRLIELSLPANVRPEELDEQADEVTAGLYDSERERIQQRVAAMNAVYGAPDRVRQLSEDVVAHWKRAAPRCASSSVSPARA
jgi:type I restriction enzyme R subunit